MKKKTRNKSIFDRLKYSWKLKIWDFGNSWNNDQKLIGFSVFDSESSSYNYVWKLNICVQTKADKRQIKMTSVQHAMITLFEPGKFPGFPTGLSLETLTVRDQKVPGLKKSKSPGPFSKVPGLFLKSGDFPAPFFSLFSCLTFYLPPKILYSIMCIQNLELFRRLAKKGEWKERA